ncbi:calreticulin [Salpingoeca rosetta]|uniref:Calreticulin n=1 Tax=Salpingoeca rosetta (strain ATCC 50818 / BSB-021) TaxID=946362 RepID=F2U9P4_SALR5|nr:calreticulin [Salpingoeca rosetta]EGD73071.1 calreticulin [Salpingoeca rosetta]|eukprot:XP_004994102.1 calreticulin [Salpingoeca rosetta]
MYKLLLASAALLVATASAEVFFQESFGDGWEDRWVVSKHSDDYGKWDVTAGKYYNDAEEDKGLHTTQNAKFYAISGRFDDFSNKDKELYVQFVVKHEQNIDCGGGYVKLFPASLDQEDMHGESPYNVMFGPDICGQGTRKVHVILNYKGENVQTKKSIPCKFDEASHLYTLVLKPDNTYEVRIDGEKVEGGSIEEDFDMLPPKMIKDPSVSKPEDWVDEKEIPDPEDEKPEDWDQPEHIPDPDAEKPEDWDDEMDGEWEPPMIPNPEYKGEWKPRMIPNPEYKGEWEHPMIENPEYEPNDSLYAYDSFGVLGFDLWQVKAGTIFDDVLITDDSSAVDAAVEHFKQRAEGEAAMKKAEEEAEAAKKAAEEAAAKAQEAEEEDDEDEDEEEDDEEEDEDEEAHDEL